MPERGIIILSWNAKCKCIGESGNYKTKKRCNDSQICVAFLKCSKKQNAFLPFLVIGILRGATLAAVVIDAFFRLIAATAREPNQRGKPESE